MPEQCGEKAKGTLFITYRVDNKLPLYNNLRSTSKYSVKNVLSILESSPCTLQ